MVADLRENSVCQELMVSQVRRVHEETAELMVTPELLGLPEIRVLKDQEDSKVSASPYDLLLSVT